jgi:two-component system, response regulator PdtaR
MPKAKAVVLVVEDDGIIRMGAVDLILRAGFEALEAGNADEAIKILRGRPDIHLVFTDVEMPGTMDGIKLSHYIRDRWPPIKLIVASGRTIVEQSSLPEGARFFGKPYNEIDLVQSITRMVA